MRTRTTQISANANTFDWCRTSMWICTVESHLIHQTSRFSIRTTKEKLIAHSCTFDPTQIYIAFIPIITCLSDIHWCLTVNVTWRQAPVCVSLQNLKRTAASYLPLAPVWTPTGIRHPCVQANRTSGSAALTVPPSCTAHRARP